MEEKKAVKWSEQNQLIKDNKYHKKELIIKWSGTQGYQFLFLWLWCPRQLARTPINSIHTCYSPPAQLQGNYIHWGMGRWEKNNLEIFASGITSLTTISHPWVQ